MSPVETLLGTPLPSSVEPPPSGPSATDLEAAAAAGAQIVAYNPKKLRDFVLGRITLGELEGIGKKAQYELAETGYAYLAENLLDKARRIFRGLALLDPYDAYFQLALGWIAQRENQLEEAEGYFSRSLEINPYSAPALAGRGEVRLRRGKLLEAAQDLTGAVREDPEVRQPATSRALALIAILRKQLEATA
ncbi:MAG TPA: hypothetical protein PK413_08660 [Thermoanaerobaculia bacterium]|nr:hypothetical protein [Thermoanaerobaculia bacterium]